MTSPVASVMCFSSVYPNDLFLLSSHGSGLHMSLLCPSVPISMLVEPVYSPTDRLCIFCRSVRFLQATGTALFCREIAWSFLPAIHFTASMAGHCCLNCKRCLLSYLCTKLSCYCAASLPRCHPILTFPSSVWTCRGLFRRMANGASPPVLRLCPRSDRVGFVLEKKWNGTGFFFVHSDSSVRYSTSVPDSWWWWWWSSSPWPFICHWRSVV